MSISGETCVVCIHIDTMQIYKRYQTSTVADVISVLIKANLFTMSFTDSVITSEIYTYMHNFPRGFFFIIIRTNFNSTMYSMTKALAPIVEQSEQDYPDTHTHTHDSFICLYIGSIPINPFMCMRPGTFWTEIRLNEPQSGAPNVYSKGLIRKFIRDLHYTDTLMYVHARSGVNQCDNESTETNMQRKKYENHLNSTITQSCHIFYDECIYWT